MSGIGYVCCRLPPRISTANPPTVALNPGLISFMLQVIMKLRWDETGILPQTQVRLTCPMTLVILTG
jgi:hypothetical protein